MKDCRNKVIYVGKAKNLKKRVASYFVQKNRTNLKTKRLVENIRDFDFFLTANDVEAFVLENNLIKKYRPKYNILMRDDKSYPYIIINKSEDFPRPEYKRRPSRNENKKIYGPFVHGSNISECLKILKQSFKLRDCSIKEFNSRKNPCLLYQINQCSAPCVSKITHKEYLKDFEYIIDFFEGRGDRTIKYLSSKMTEYANNEEFEKAVLIRDNIDTLKSFLNMGIQKNTEFKDDKLNLDCVAFFESDNEIDLSIYCVRNGLLLGLKKFDFFKDNLLEENIEIEVSRFLLQYYLESNDTLPNYIICNIDDYLNKLLEESLIREKYDKKNKLKIKRPKTKFKSLYNLTLESSIESFNYREGNDLNILSALNKLQELFSLKERPVRIECFDVAVFQGSSPTASMVVFENGKALKKEYRHYKLQELKEKNNDFKMMEEVFTRRLSSNEKMPDLIIVDGGVGQVNVVKRIINDLKLSIPVGGIAKSKTKSHVKTEERLFIENRVNPYILKKHLSLFRLITTLRNEAHRFSRRLHHKLEKSKLIKSWTDDIKGLNSKVKNDLINIKNYSKLEISQMSSKELKNIFNLSDASIKKLKNYFS